MKSIRRFPLFSLIARLNDVSAVRDRPWTSRYSEPSLDVTLYRESWFPRAQLQGYLVRGWRVYHTSYGFVSEVQDAFRVSFNYREPGHYWQRFFLKRLYLDTPACISEIRWNTPHPWPAPGRDPPALEGVTAA